MSIFTVKEQMDALVAELNQHTYNYYVLAMPTIADYEFDKKLEELIALEKAHPEFADPNSRLFFCLFFFSILTTYREPTPRDEMSRNSISVHMYLCKTL